MTQYEIPEDSPNRPLAVFANTVGEALVWLIGRTLPKAKRP